MTKITKNYASYMDGAWVDAGSRALMEVENPATGEVFATVTSSSMQDVQDALESSRRAQKKWQQIPAFQRGQHLMSIVDKLALEREHFARLLVMEQGKTLAEAFGEVDDTMRYLSYSAEAARRLEGSIFPSENPGEHLSIHKVPYGVSVGLCAYNYPLALIGRKVGPALVTGNTMVIKPHEVTPVTASEFCRLVDETDMPPGVINMVSGAGAEVGSALVESPITRLVSMTGSIRAGQAIYKSAANNITALILELGGKAPFIVLDDADMDLAVEAAVVARFANCGQVCICNEMVMVHEKVADEFAERVAKRVAQIRVGDPMKEVDMGPAVTAKGLDRVDQIVQDNIKQGAELLTGGKRPEGAMFEKGNWYEPTVLYPVKNDHEAAKHEIFGPVMPIVKVSGYEEALSLANARKEGLSAYLFTRDYKKFMHAIDHLEVGTIFINRGIVGYIQGYHSGHKLSGVGGEDGVFGIEGYMQKRTIYLNY